MKRISVVIVLSLLMSGGLIASRAEAATLTVPSTAFPTIQDAVDAANPGDVISIKSGTYFEDVIVNNTKNNIVISGPCPKPNSPNRKKRRPKPAIIDAEGTGSGTALDIAANNVRVQCLTTRHGSNGIVAAADGIVIDRVRAVGASTDNVQIDGDNFRVTRSLFVEGDSENLDIEGAPNTGGLIENNVSRNGGGSCFEIDADNTTVRNNKADSCDDGGIRLFGNDNVVSRNTMTNQRNDGFQIEGDNNQILSNVGINTADNVFDIAGLNVVMTGNVADHPADDDCIDVEGNGMRLEGNRATNCDGGFELSGQDPVVLNNVVTKAGDDDGFDIDCSTSCGAGRVEGNRESGNTSDDEGFEITVAAASGTGFRVVNNSATNNSEEAFQIFGSDMIIQGNVATLNGGSDSFDGDGIEIDGNNNQISNNTSTNNADDGLNVSGDGNTISGNSVSGNIKDGLHLEGGIGNTLDANVAKNNDGEGIENDGTATVITNNTSSGNRMDCAGSVAPATNTGNSCADGSDFTVDGVVD